MSQDDKKYFAKLGQALKKSPQPQSTAETIKNKSFAELIQFIEDSTKLMKSLKKELPIKPATGVIAFRKRAKELGFIK